MPSPLSNSAGAGLLPAGTVLITSDDRGIASRLADRFSTFDQPTVILKHVDGKRFDEGNDTVIEADWSDEENVSAIIDKLHQTEESIAGLVHLLPLSGFADSDSLIERSRRDCRSFYLLARELEKDLIAAAEIGNAILLATTSIDGRLGYAASNDDHLARAAHGGILGLTKCIGLEWPDVIVRAVDVCPSMSTDEVLEQLIAELSETDSPLEVGVSLDGRITWKPIDASLNGKSEGEPLLQKGDTVVITGGARGITAEMAVGLASKYKPHLVLFGRSPLPEQTEPASVKSAADENEIKKALIAEARERGEAPKPAEIGRAAKRITAAREIRETLSRIEAADATVDYRSVDVSDPIAFRQAICEVQSFGPIVGVVHGAGVIEDKLLRDKTPESFDRVFNTKVNSTATLAETLDPTGLKFLALFASVASRFGNRGQGDYAAANEVLGKVACKLNQMWPQTRSFAVAWGPWAEIGMVADLEKHLTARGLTLIPPAVGVQMFLDEISRGDHDTPEVIIAGGAEHLADPN